MTDYIQGLNPLSVLSLILHLKRLFRFFLFLFFVKHLFFLRVVSVAVEPGKQHNQSINHI